MGAQPAAAAAFVLVDGRCGSPPPPEAPAAEQVQADPGDGTPTMTPPDPATADTRVPPAMPADPSYQAGPYKGAMTAPPAEAMNKTYPLCCAHGAG